MVRRAAEGQLESLLRLATAARPNGPRGGGLPLLPRLDKLGRSCIDFDWLERDPRPVQPDLEQLPFDKDPRRFYYSWRCLEKSLGVARRRTADSPPFRFYVCVANQVPRFEQIDDEGKAMARYPLTGSAVRQQVHRQRWSESIEWEGTSNPDVRCLGRGQAVPDPSRLLAEGRRKRRERGATTALGMWIFPGEAFGQVKKDDLGDLYRQQDRVTVSVSELPGLAVFDI
ncbi:hypothetical protein PG997_012593 [Apiospora hydei]|uniref:Uncharacterized protein n=1 Tax=Apiospora hydei TaxID=1337664 RepID=A0ABR1V3T2_9PEZI